jgi:ABC-2 type transport system ATP-binding protein
MMKDLILLEKNKGKIIILTTHNMEEADELCHRIAFLNHGHVIECGKPEDLKLKYSKQTIELTTQDGKRTIPLNKEKLISELKDIDELLMIHSIEPSLKEVFLFLTEGE